MLERESRGKVLVRGERWVKVWEKRGEKEVFLVLDEEGLGEGSISGFV
jgi:hypothetical protein